MSILPLPKIIKNTTKFSEKTRNPSKGSVVNNLPPLVNEETINRYGKEQIDKALDVFLSVIPQGVKDVGRDFGRGVQGEVIPNNMPNMLGVMAGVVPTPIGIVNMGSSIPEMKIVLNRLDNGKYMAKTWDELTKSWVEANRALFTEGQARRLISEGRAILE